MPTPDMKNLTQEQREEVHREAESRIRTFSYEKPPSDPTDTRPKKIIPLDRSEHIRLAVQVVKEGGENNLHYHTNSDGAWMVLKGRVRFYGPENKVYGEFGPHEGIILPGGSRYWFEKVGDEELEILQMFGYPSKDLQSSRVNIERHKDWMKDDAFLQVYDEPAKAGAAE
jgi:mannose-6-phosphate isomerase-like protein (cupin superfamily)